MYTLNKYLYIVSMRSEADPDLVKDSRAKELFIEFERDLLSKVQPFQNLEDIFPILKFSKSKENVRLKKERNLD